MRIKLQRLIRVWAEDVFEVDNFNDDIKEQMFNYEVEPLYTETLWETQEEEGPYTLLDEDNKVIEEGSF